MIIKTRTLQRISFPFIICAALIFIAAGPTIQKKTRILVFTKTAGFVHSAIPAGTKALLNSAKENGFQVDTTANATKFNTDNLERYDAIVFLNTTGDAHLHFLK